MSEETEDTEERRALRERLASLVAAIDENPEPPAPLASVVAITELFDIQAKGCDQAVATVSSGDGVVRHVAVPRDAFHEGDLCVLFATNACVRSTPVYEKWRWSNSLDLRFDFGKFGIQVNYIAFKGNKSFFRHSPGILIPVGELPEVAGRGVGEDVAQALGACRHDDVRKLEMPRLEAEYASACRNRHVNKLKAKYYQARDWRAHCPSVPVCKAPPYVKVTRLEDLAQHPEYFELYRDMLFDVTEKYNGLNLSVIYSALGGVRISYDGMEIAEDDTSHFWKIIRRQGIDRALEEMGYDVVVEGVVTGPSIRGGIFEGRAFERFCAFNVYDNEDGRDLCPSERASFCREANLPHVQIVAKGFPLFQRATTIAPLLRSAARPNTSGGLRYGLVFRSSEDFEDVAFQLTNPEYRPCPEQLEVDAVFDAKDNDEKDKKDEKEEGKEEQA